MNDETPQGDTTPLENIEAEGSKPTITNNPDDSFRVLVKNLTVDTNNKLKSFLLPPDVLNMFRLGPCVYKITHRNVGQSRFTAEFYGVPNPDGSILRPGGNIEHRPQLPHEIGRNTKNVTLDVHSGSIDSTSIFGPRSKDKDGQNPTS